METVEVWMSVEDMYSKGCGDFPPLVVNRILDDKWCCRFGTDSPCLSLQKK